MLNVELCMLDKIIVLNKFNFDNKSAMDSINNIKFEDCSSCVFQIDADQQAVEYRDYTTHSKLKYADIKRYNNKVGIFINGIEGEPDKLLIFNSYMEVTKL